MNDLELDEFASEEMPEPMLAFESDIERLNGISDELGCSAAELNELVAERAERLEAISPAARLVLESFLMNIETGDLFEEGTPWLE